MADIFEAIADPTRRNIMETLLSAQVAGSELTVSELVQKTGLGQPTVSKHLKTLLEVGLVAAREDGQKRFYSVTPEPLEEIEDWMINFLSLGFEAEGEEDLAKNLSEAGEKLGHWITEKASWLGEQLRARADELDVDVDPKELGKRLGRKLAETKVDAEKGAKDFEKLARQKVEEVVDDVRSEATHFAEEVRPKVGKK
ncbi:MAG: ArsR/SmtB family transcription factor [Aquiluna sp.]